MQVRNEVQKAQKNPAAFRIGAFHGLGGLIYLFTHVAVLWNEPALLEEAIEIVELLLLLIALDEEFDMISGLAGCENKQELHRVAQEALHNVVKHASATRGELRLARIPKR